MATAEQIAQRREWIIARYSAGMTYRAIAEAEFAEGRVDKQRTPQAVREDAHRALKDRAETLPGRDLARNLELERIAAERRAAETVLRAAQRNSRCGACGRTGDEDLVLKALDRLDRIGKRTAKLLALEADRTPDAQVEDEIDVLRKRVGLKLVR